jgi:hypothetical protein
MGTGIFSIVLGGLSFFTNILLAILGFALAGNILVKGKKKLSILSPEEKNGDSATEANNFVNLGKIGLVVNSIAICTFIILKFA